MKGPFTIQNMHHPRILAVPRTFQFSAALLCLGAADATPLPYWNQSVLDPLIIPYGGSSLVVGNVTWTRLLWVGCGVAGWKSFCIYAWATVMLLADTVR